MLKRASDLCSSPELFKKEVQYIRQVFLSNDYPQKVIDKVVKRFLDGKQAVVRPEHKKINCVLPYVPKISENISRCWKKVCARHNFQQNVAFAYKPIRKIAQNFPMYEDCSTRECVYKINCSECNSSYIGETGRHLQTRFIEHNNIKTSAIYQHVNSTKHSISFEDCEVLCRESSSALRKIRESMLIREQKPNLNRSLGTDLYLPWTV